MTNVRTKVWSDLVGFAVRETTAEERFATYLLVERNDARFHHQAELRTLLYSCESLSGLDLDYLVHQVNSR